MSVAKVTEIIASSKKSFQDAIEVGIARANKTIENIKTKAKTPGPNKTFFKIYFMVNFPPLV